MFLTITTAPTVIIIFIFTEHPSFGWDHAMSFMLIPTNNPMW